jgi:glycosyltransferase involved in cell wall biosynthesis
MNVGGTARYVGELVEKIPNSKLATGYVQGSEIEDPCVEKLNVLRIPHMGRKISPLKDFRAWLELRKIIEEIKPAIVHTHTFKAGLVGRLIGGEYKRVHTFHGHLFDDQSFSSIEKYIITKAEKFLAKRTDLLISVGKKVGVELRAQGIGAGKEWISIAPGINKLPLIEKGLARKSLGLSIEGVIFGWMARMAEVKNPFLLLEIARQLPEASFVMAGGGKLLLEIKLKAPKNVTVIGWADAATFWSAVDCAISTSDNEGMPVALIEAQLAGVPVIATDVGSNAEVIEDGVTGIVTSKNPQELIDAVEKLVKGEKFLQKMGDAGREHATEEFSLEKMLNMHHQAYLSLIK